MSWRTEDLRPILILFKAQWIWWRRRRDMQLAPVPPNGSGSGVTRSRRCRVTLSRPFQRGGAGMSAFCRGKCQSIKQGLGTMPFVLCSFPPVKDAPYPPKFYLTSEESRAPFVLLVGTRQEGLGIVRRASACPLDDVFITNRPAKGNRHELHLASHFRGSVPLDRARRLGGPRPEPAPAPTRQGKCRMFRGTTINSRLLKEPVVPLK
jgi:hypothetical protein